MSLKQRTISGILWSLLESVGGKGVTFIVTIILARLLTPEIFGLIGMLMIFIQLSQVLVQAGFNQALIQKKDTDEEDYSSVFWINLVASILIYTILFFASSWIAHFYEQPILVRLVRVLGLVFVINAFSYVQEAKLQKEMRFKTLTLIHIPSVLVGGVTSIVMAISGFGVWSLVVLQLTTAFSYSIQMWFWAKWKPLWRFNLAKAKALFSFGGNLMVTSIIGTLFNNVYVIIIGKFFPLNMVGYYQNANKLVQQPANTLSGALNKVMFPSFSTIQDDDVRLKNGYKKTIQQMLFLICPIFTLLGVLADPLFNIVFGVKWLPAVPYFQILCVVGILYPLNLFNVNILKVKGRSGLYLRLALIKRGIAIIGIIITIRFGIWYLLCWQAGSEILNYYINSYYSGKLIGYPTREQVYDIMPVLIMSFFIGLIVFILEQYIHGIADGYRISIGIILGFLLYWCFSKIGSFEPYNDFLTILKNRKLYKGSNI